MACSPSANFLGMPKELRLQIYEHVVELSIQYAVLKGYDKKKYGSYGHTLKSHDTSLQLPWLNLQRTCWTIYDELLGFMRTTPSTTIEDRHTYQAELRPNQPRGFILESLTWRQMPCPPQQARRVVATIKAQNSPNGVCLAGDGGVPSIITALWQSLRHFLHCGPTLNKYRILFKPMHIEELVIIYEHGEEATPDEMAAWALRYPAPLHGRRQPMLSRHQQSYDSLCREFGGVLHFGILFGYIDKVVLRSAWDRYESVVTEGPGVPDYWARAGFKWDGLRPKDFTDYFEELPIHLLHIEADAAV